MRLKYLMIACIFALSGCAGMSEGQRNASIGCAAGLGVGVIGDRTIVSPMSGLLVPLGCAAGAIGGYFLTPEENRGKK